MGLTTKKRTGYRGKSHFSFPLPIGVICLVAALIIYAVSFGEAFGALILALVGMYFLVFGALGLVTSSGWPGRAAFILRRAMLIALSVMAASFIVIECMILSGAHTDPDAEGSDFLIVLGAGIRGETPSAALTSRLSAAVSYCGRNPDAQVILTGGQGPTEAITEALAMQRYFISHGVSSERIIMEEKALDTIQNVRFSKDIIDAASAQNGIINPKVTILSNDFHIFRARYIASRIGLGNVTAVSAPMPYFHLRVTYYVREYFSMLKVFLVT